LFLLIAEGCSFFSRTRKKPLARHRLYEPEEIEGR
jgi:hypothetical protein